MILETDEQPLDIEFSNAEGKGAAALAGIAALGTVGAALASRPKTLTEVEQKCGKRPVLRGKKRTEWEKCSKEFASASVQPIVTSNQPTNTTQKKVPTWAWIVVGVVVAGLIGLVVYKSVKK